jgi:hypothetical protein
MRLRGGAEADGAAATGQWSHPNNYVKEIVMNLIYTVLVALPLGLFISSRSTAVLSYLLVGSYLFSFQSTSVLLGWLGDSSTPAFGPSPEGFPAQAVTSEVIGYGVVNAVITIIGVGLVLAGARLRARRASRAHVVTVA